MGAPSLDFETWDSTILRLLPQPTTDRRWNGASYRSIVNPALRFNCQHSSFDSVQNGFSLP